MRDSKILPVACVLYLPISGGFDFVFIDYILQYIDSVSLVFLRLLFCTIILMAVLRAKEGRFCFQKKDLWKFFLGGAFGFGWYYTVEALGIQNAGASLASLLLATVPVFGMIGDALIFKNRITAGKVIGVAGSILGVAVILFGSPNSDMRGNLIGVALVLLAAIFWVVYMVIAKPLNDGYSSLAVTTGLFAGGVISNLPLFLLGNPGAVLQLSPVNLLLIAGSGVIILAVAQLGYIYGLKTVSVTFASLVKNLLPFTTILVSWILFHQMLRPIQLLGGLIIIASITFTSLSGKK